MLPGPPWAPLVSALLYSALIRSTQLNSAPPSSIVHSSTWLHLAPLNSVLSSTQHLWTPLSSTKPHLTSLGPASGPAAPAPAPLKFSVSLGCIRLLLACCWHLTLVVCSPPLPLFLLALSTSCRSPESWPYPSNHMSSPLPLLDFTQSWLLEIHCIEKYLRCESVPVVSWTYTVR